MIDYSKRKERILCIAHNTIRLNDLPLQKLIFDTIGIPSSQVQQAWRVLNRQDTVIGTEYGVTEETFNNIKYSSYAEIYKDAPYTNFQKILDGLKQVNFVDESFILYNTFGDNVDVSELSEPGYTKLVYNGSVDDIKEIITKYNITAIILDNVSIMYQIVKDMNVDGKTFMVSKMGYNFEKSDNNKYKMKHEEVISIMETSKKFEFAFVELTEFTESEIAEAKANG